MNLSSIRRTESIILALLADARDRVLLLGELVTEVGCGLLAEDAGIASDVHRAPKQLVQ